MSVYSIYDVFAATARRRPKAPALRLGDQRWTYGQLLARAEELGAALRADGVRPHDRVALYQPKSLDGVAALLAILQCGASYVPVDPQAPPERARYVVEHAGAQVLFTAGRPQQQYERSGLPWPNRIYTPTPGPLPAERVRRLDQPLPPGPPRPSVPDSALAYILYTSGSTGAPKGVAITHAQSLAFVRPAAEVFGLNEEDVLASHAPFNFDLSVIDLWCAFLVGAEVALLAETWLGFPVKLAEALEKAKVSVWNSVPSALIQLVSHGHLEARDLSALRLVMFAGEPYPPKHLRALRAAIPGARLLNVYGQTEANSSTYVYLGEIPDDDQASVPIGRPFPNYEVLLLGDDRQPILGPGQDGELYVIGNAVASGYWKDPERSAAAFVQHPLSPERRQIVYKTGDRARYDEQGQLHFRGRADQAVKCRGFRVEPGEVEATALAFGGLLEAAVIPVPHEEAGHLLALYLGAAGPVDQDALRAHLAARLPRYMLPEAIEVRPELPRGPTGKIDKKALRADAELLLGVHTL